MENERIDYSGLNELYDFAELVKKHHDEVFERQGKRFFCYTHTYGCP